MTYETTTRLTMSALSLVARGLGRLADTIGRPDVGDDLRYFADAGRGRHRGNLFYRPRVVEAARLAPEPDHD